MTTRYAYGRADGGEMGEYSFMLGMDQKDAQSLATDYASDEHGYGVEPCEMVVYELRPVLIGRPVITIGEDLGDGDKEPDEFERMEWAAPDD